MLLFWEENEKRVRKMPTETEKTDSNVSSEDSPKVEESDGKESNQRSHSVDEVLTEIINTNKITRDDTQPGQEPQEKGVLEKVDGKEQNEVEEAPLYNIFEAIEKINQSSTDIPEQETASDIDGNLCEICANDIMRNQIAWASGDDSLEQVIEKMQQMNSGYILVGQHGKLEGIVSKSDVTKAMSPYLMPIFVKWRRPLDDATLKIRIKWIMSKPVHTIKPEALLAVIMEEMNRFRVRCLPVTDDEGNVRGLVTIYDVFEALLKIESNARSEGDSGRELVEQVSSEHTN